MKIAIEINVPDDFVTSMDMQSIVEAEIKADRWLWRLPENADLRAAASLPIEAPFPPPAPAGGSEAVLVPRELLERARESLGAFVSDHGWADADMNTADDLSGFLAATPSMPAPATGGKEGAK